MSLWKRLFGIKRFRRYPDSFTLTQANKRTTLIQWVRDLHTRTSSVVVVLSHFQSTFLANQEALQESGLDFEILAQPASEEELASKLARDKGPRLILTMAQMLIPSSREPTQPAASSANKDPALSVIVTERYPVLANDENLERFFEQVRLPVAIGYLISFDDPIVVHLLGTRFVELLKQLGLGENDLVSSTMTNRGLSRKIRKATAAVVQEQFAESPEEWIQLNLPGEV